MQNYQELLDSILPLGEIEFIGKTVNGYPIPLVKVGESPNILIVSSVHAREWITTYLTNELVKKAKNISFHYLPMLNIDGVLLCKNGKCSIIDEYLRQKMFALNDYNEDFSQWKANIQGVDLNVNFDADWGEGEHNVTTCGSANFIGISPNNQPETQAVVRLLETYDYPLIMCYHSNGEVIYWGYDDNFCHYNEAQEFADKLGYELTRSENSCGGIKDFYSKNYRGLGLTIEVGESGEKHPYPLEKLDKLVSRHLGSLELANKLGGKIARKIYARGDS